ncbi:MAG: DUF6364 family protein [Bacteroidota bacterium]
MDAKITLSFDKKVIERAKQYAEHQNISLSRLMEFLLDKITSAQYASLEDLPVSDWVNAVAEGQAEYITKPKKGSKLKAEYMNRKR